MNIEKLKEYYTRIDACFVKLDNSDISFDYIQTQISKTSFHTEELNRAMGELFVEMTELEHKIATAKFDYELNVVSHLATNSDVKSLTTGKERLNYINYVLMKDSFKSLTTLEQELRDVNSLLEFTKKKAKDLDRAYPKLKTLWESVQTELKTIKNVGSDEKYINKVRDSIQADNLYRKPLFMDASVELIKSSQYNEDEEDEEEPIVKEASKPNVDQYVDELLADL